MKEKIEQLSKGIFVYQAPALCLPEKIEVSVETGKVFTGSILIRNEKNSRMKGVIYSSSRWFVIEDDKFIGPANEIHYHVDAAYLRAGEVIQGAMSIVSDCGEAAVPFTVTVEEPYCTSSLGRIKDMFQFANLAKSSPAEARKMFASEDFGRMLAAYDKKYLVLYRHLLGSRSHSQALEEFLFCIHKKLRINFSVDRTNFEYEDCISSFSERITIHKDNWGYLEIRAFADADFIGLDHKIIWTDNFVGDDCSLEFVVDAEKLREGANYARITLKSIYQEAVIEVVCHKRHSGADYELIKNQGRTALLRSRAELTETYIRFRLGGISVSKYLQESRNILDRILCSREEEYFDVPEEDESMLRFELYRIHLNLVAGKEGKSRALLKSLSDRKEEIRSRSAAEYCALLYLEALHQKDEEYVKNVCAEIWEIYEKEAGDWEILWFLLYLDKRYDENRELKLSDIRTQFEAGCHSPVLYFEAASVYNADGELLSEITPFEIQVMHFCAKHGCLSKDTASDFTCLAAREKDFNPMIYKVLVQIYEKYKLKDTLAAIISMLIKGHKTSEKYFPWFEKGVSESLRILELYEYYMYSLPETIEEPIAQPVTTYFIYNNNLNDRKKDYLFANIIYHKEEMASIYRSYLKQIEAHALKQLSAKALSPYLAVIYDDVLGKEMLTPEIARLLPDLVFQYDLECHNPAIRQACVVHKEDGREVFSAFIDGVARVELYTEDAEIILIDQNENRYSATVDYTLYPLMHAGDYLKRCYELEGTDPRLVLNLAEKAQGYQKFDETSLEQRIRAAGLPDISEELRNEYLDTLVHYYYDNFENELLDHVLLEMDLKYLPQSERSRMMELLIVRDQYQRAAEAIAEFGSDEIAVKRLLKLSWYLIQEREDISGNRVFLEVCYSIFCQGKYDEPVLKYLVHNFYGTTFEMHQIWKAARAFEVDTFLLEDRLLAQMLFTENFIEESLPVFRSYYRSGCNRKLVRAALSYYAYCCLTDRRGLTQELFDTMKRELSFEENDICMLAVLKFYSEQELFTDSELSFIDLELQKLSEKGIRLSFFKRFGDRTRVSRSMMDSDYVTFRTEPGTKVLLVYSVISDTLDETKIGAAFSELSEKGKRVMMPHIICGIYESEFVLFSDEALLYEIFEQGPGEPECLSRGIVRTNPENLDGGSRFGILNQIVNAVRDGREEEAYGGMKRYLKADHIIRRAFRPIEVKKGREETK